MEKEERIKRVLARGEHSGHSHILIGGTIEDNGDITVPEEGAWLKHLLETAWVEEEKQEWTGEHKDIWVKQGTYRLVHQVEYDPYIGMRRVRD